MAATRERQHDAGIEEQRRAVGAPDCAPEVEQQQRDHRQHDAERALARLEGTTPSRLRATIARSTASRRQSTGARGELDPTGRGRQRLFDAFEADRGEHRAKST